jgi:predicted AlkP superfamily pyrophosphatase or phosphodiesterase
MNQLKQSMFSIFLLLCSCLPMFAQTRYVVIVTIDGGASYHLDDPALELPNIRSLITAGVRASSSETVFPSVTHPSHTTIITGVMPRKHGVLANELAERTSDRLIPGNSLTRSKIILTKTIFDTAKAKGLSTAAFQWPETVEDASIDFNLISRTSPEGHHIVKNQFYEELKKDGVPVEQFEAWRRIGSLTSMYDGLTTQAACATIKKHKPNLLAIHLVNTDHMQHTYGPQHYLAKASLTDVDHQIGQLMQASKEAGTFNETTFIITADHGFTSVYDEINIRPLFAAAGLEDKVKFYEGGWAPFIRLLPSFNPAVDQPKLDQLFAQMMKNMHIIRILKSEDYPSIGLPTWEESDRVRGQYLIVGDAETYFVWTADNDTSLRKRKHPAHGHGYLATYPKMFPMLVISGSGIKKGQMIGHVHNIDIAPTVSQLLGLEKLGFDGRVLTEALAN